MSLALYRRYRPETYAEVIGQEHVTGPLQQALRNNRVNHAYLFSGPRGCGKTTSARILARCLNCERGPTPDPCGECRSCQDLARNGPGSIDVIEIDAASHGGVDDARDLREKAFFGPASSRYKIYIIDEAHMVTPAGFNALLKVVEEPPEHLKFIFATTEPEKVIGTIRSRTHHYPFRLVPPGTLRDYLGEVCSREGIAVDDGVLPLVVRAGAGSVRDSMSVMDQLLAGAGEQGVTYAMATALLGYTDAALLDEVVDAFAAHDGAAVFEVVDRVIEGGHDPRRFVADLLERLRDLVILAAVPDAGEKGLIDAPADVVERMQAQASVFGSAELSRAADLVNTGLTEMRGATSPRLQLELICARVLLPGAYDDERSLQARLEKLERGVALGGGVLPVGPTIGVAESVAVRGGAPGGFPAHPAGAAPTAPTALTAPAAPTTAADGPETGAGAGGRTTSGLVLGGPATPSPAHVVPPPNGGVGAEGSVAGAPPTGRPGAWPVPRGPKPAPGGPQPAPGIPQPGQAAQPAGAAAGPGAQPAGAAAGQAVAPPASTAPPASSTPPAPPAATTFAATAPTAQAVDGGAAAVRQMWPQILDAVKHRRRFTWILLSQNAQVAGFDGGTLQISFGNVGARDSFVNGGSDEVLRQAVGDLGHQWRVEAIVDPSATGGAGSGAPAPTAPPPSRPGPVSPAPGPATGLAGPPGTASAPTVPAPAPAPPTSGNAPGNAPGRAAPPPGPVPPPVAPEDDIPQEDDPDLDEAALTGHDLIVRELGGVVVEEIPRD
nr:DNA polymerase III subunit gamma and tau [Wenjunlia vitaminophila]